jgi:hypothetical protein
MMEKVSREMPKRILYGVVSGKASIVVQKSGVQEALE